MKLVENHDENDGTRFFRAEVLKICSLLFVTVASWESGGYATEKSDQVQLGEPRLEDGRQSDCEGAFVGAFSVYHLKKHRCHGSFNKQKPQDL